MLGQHQHEPGVFDAGPLAAEFERTSKGRSVAGTPPNKQPLLVAEHVHKVYRTGEIKVQALVDLNLAVDRGEMVAVMGPSGSGKTTLLNCLSGLDDIDGGRVLVEGRDLFGMSDAARTTHRARAMGFIFQSFNLIPVFTAAENVELPLLLAGTPAGQARKRAAEMLERVGLGPRTGHRPNELSGGEQQRVTIARALASRPAIVWADEPTGNLDSHMADQVVELLHELNHVDGQTIVLVTHDVSIGASVPRLIHMRDGRLVRDERRVGDGQFEPGAQRAVVQPSKE
jgi:putative ABC transport system ATP-binding protein